MEEQDSSSELLQETWASMKHRMLGIAFKDRSLDAWTLRKVQEIGLYERELDPVEGDLDLEILQDPKHSGRKQLPPGPLVLYLTEDPEPRGRIVELSELVLSGSRDIREAVLLNIDAILDDDRFGATPKTLELLGADREALLADDASIWRPAALAMSQAMNDDVLIAMQGIWQCLSVEPVITAGLEIFLQRVLNPEYSSYESIHPFDSSETLAEQLQSEQEKLLSSADSLKEACSKYYLIAGHLPLAPDHGFPGLVSEWMLSHPEVDVWRELWDWAESEAGYLAEYHASTVFIAHPEWIPQGEMPALWDSVLGVIHGSSKSGEGSPGHVRWLLIHSLTKHFMYHIEASVPQGDGFKISSLAWLLAERVASILERAPGKIEFYLENWVHKALKHSSHIWHIGCPPITDAPLRALLLSTGAPWAYSLACTMGGGIRDLLTDEVSPEAKEQLHDGLMSQIIPSLPLPLEPSGLRVFASDLTLVPLIEDCIEMMDADYSGTLGEMLRLSKELTDPVKLCEEVRGLLDSDPIGQFMLVITLRNQAYRGVDIAEQLWPIISDECWWMSVLGQVESHILDLLMEALNAVQIRAGGDWFWRLPHVIADLCVKVDDEKLSHDMFLYLIQFSLASDTVSAIQRLLASDVKDKYQAIADEYRTRYLDRMGPYPHWIEGRIRSLLSVLRIE